MIALILIVCLFLSFDPGYSRDKFPHWNRTGANCDVRDTILERDGSDIIKRGCNVVDGVWYSYYDSKTLHATRDVHIDHIVPLAEAWRTGASTWTQQRRQEFANDPINLRAVSASSNRAKGDQGIDEWTPRERCQEYMYIYRSVKAKYKLVLTYPEEVATC